MSHHSSHTVQDCMCKSTSSSPANYATHTVPVRSRPTVCSGAQGSNSLYTCKLIHHAPLVDQNLGWVIL